MMMNYLEKMATISCNGGSGLDTLTGGLGNDTYIVDSTTDTIVELQGGGSSDTVESSVSYTLGAFLNNLTLTGTDSINGTGNEYDNTITGNTGTNTLRCSVVLKV